MRAKETTKNIKCQFHLDSLTIFCKQPNQPHKMLYNCALGIK